jgi:hypothetical protein
MPKQDSIVAVYATHDAAEAAIRRVAEGGLDMQHFSIIGKGYHTEEKVVGFYTTGDRVKFWGSRGAYWGGLWGLLFGGMMLTIPVVGPVMVLGPIAAAVFGSLAAGVEGAVVMGGLGALGAALYGIGIPEKSVLQYEQALKADQFLVLANGPAAEMERARVMLQLSGPVQVDVHQGAEALHPVAA